MKLHALLIGINDYPFNPLYSCKSDVEKIQDYLINAPEIKENFEAVKALVINGMNDTEVADKGTILRPHL